MSSNNSSPECDDIPIVTLIQRLKDGSVSAKTLTKDQRQSCVEVLILEGYTVYQIAQLLQCNERTVRRDIAEIRQRNALSPDVEFVKQFVGDVNQKLMNHHDSLLRMAKSKETSAAEKIVALSAASKALTDLFRLLQSVGYLPSRPQQITGDIFHHHQVDDEAKTLVQLKNELVEAEKVAADSGVLNEAMSLQIKLIEKKIEAAQVTQQLIEIKQSTGVETDNLTNQQEAPNEKQS